MGKWSDYMAKNAKREYEESDPLKVIDQLRAELAAAKNRALIAEKQDERSRHLVCLWKDDREAQSKALSAMTAERDQLAADNARLREALEEIGKQLDACKTFVVGGCMGQTTDNIMKATVYHRVPYMLRELVLDALAATPAQSLAAHDAAVKVAVLREVARHMDNADFEWLMAEADRIEKEAANGKA